MLEQQHKDKAAEWRPFRVQLRWMIRRDMPEVLAIESASFDHPWCEDEFIGCLRQRNVIGDVAEHGDRILGFMIYELHRDWIRVVDFAVHQQFRRMGVGRQMAARLVGKLSAHRGTRLALTVRETNLGGQLFWSSQGFLATSCGRAAYGDTGEDAIGMECLFQEPDGPVLPACVRPDDGTRECLGR